MTDSRDFNDTRCVLCRARAKVKDFIENLIFDVKYAWHEARKQRDK